MKVRLLTALGAALMLATLSGCPALLNDNWTIVTADASGSEEAGGAPGDATLDTSTGDQAVGDSGAPSGCTQGLLPCDGGCINPSSVSNCGGCGFSCSGNSPLCALDNGSSYVCTSSCPTTSPTNCSGTCSNTSSDPFNCSACGTSCTVTIPHAYAVCEDGGCSFACDTGYSSCGLGCADFQNDSSNCGGCGASFACPAGATCSGGACMAPTPIDAGHDAGNGCPSGGCPSSSVSGFTSCPVGHCNSASGACSSAGGCFCAADSECISGKCVKVVSENDLSCGSSCTGTGARDGFNCALASPGIPEGPYACPDGSGFRGASLTCDSTHSSCYCNADAQCPSGKCIPNANNASCSPGGPCTGTGTPDFRGCQTTPAIGNCPIYIGCPNYTACQYPTCYCNSDAACASGKCIPGSYNGNCASCTGTGTDDGHGCEPAPSSIACMGTGGSACSTTLTPAPVLNASGSTCLCVADSNCSSGKCVNFAGQCTGTCTGSGSADSEGCETAASVANAWSCSSGNCDDVTSPAGHCTAAGVPCWCTSDAQCPNGFLCVSWAGCAAGACTGTGTPGAFHCAQ